MANYINTPASEHVVMYANNTKEIWERVAWLHRKIKERISAGRPAVREYLAECSSMRAIVRDAAKIARQDTWCQPTADDLSAARYRLANMIFDEVESEIKQNI